MDISSVNNIYTNMISGKADTINDSAKVASFEDALSKAQSEKDDVKLKKACQDFEAYFINLMFKEMRKTVNSDNGFIPKSQAELTFEDMMYDEVSKNAASSPNGLGLANYMYNQLKKENVFDTIPIDSE